MTCGLSEKDKNSEKNAISIAKLQPVMRHGNRKKNHSQTNKQSRVYDLVYKHTQAQIAKKLSTLTGKSQPQILSQ